MGNPLSKHFTLAMMLVALPSCGDNGSKTTDGRPDGGGMKDAATTNDAPTDGAVDESDLILHYEFEDSSTVVTDSSPRKKDGTLSDASGWTPDGRVGRGLAMTGGTPPSIFVSMPDGVLTDVDDYTIAFWVKLTSLDPWARVYDFGNGLPDPQNRFMYFTPQGWVGPANGTRVSVFGGSPENELIAFSEAKLPTGTWKHVAVVGTAGTNTIYIDGFPAIHVENAPNVPPREMEPMSSSSWLGKSRFPDDAGLNGTLDEFRIYKRALAPSEIADLAWPKRDYAYWRFDEGSGTTTRDSSDHDIPTALGDGVTWTDGRLGKALAFAGGPPGATGPTVTLAANPLANCTNELTVSVWIKLDEILPWARVFDFGTQLTRFIYIAPFDGAGVRFAMVSENGAFDLISPTNPLTTDTWHHLAATVAANGTVKLYVDGAEIASGTSPDVKPSDFANMTDLWLGKSRFEDPYLHGAIDELRIGCRALTADEIAFLSRR